MSLKSDRPYARRTIYALIGLSIFFIIMLVAAYINSTNLNDILSKVGLSNPIKPIEYDTSKWYYEMPGSYLFNYDRSVYIFPGDRLHYVVILYQKVPYPIEIKSDMQMFIGEQNVTSVQQLPYVLYLNSTNQFTGISFPFLPHDGGLNQVRVHLNIINGSNKVSLENKTEILKFDVQSQAIQLQAEANSNTFWGIVLSTATASASVIFLGYQTWQLRKEKNQTIRAWIGQKGGTSLQLVRIRNLQGVIKTIDEWGAMSSSDKTSFGADTYECLITLKNFGQIPAFDVRPRFTTALLPKVEELKDDWWEPAEIMPQDEAPYLVPIPVVWVEKVKSDANFKFYVIFEVKYRSGESKREKRYGFMSEYTHGGMTKISSWDEKKYKTPHKSKRIDVNNTGTAEKSEHNSTEPSNEASKPLTKS